MLGYIKASSCIRGGLGYIVHNQCKPIICFCVNLYYILFAELLRFFHYAQMARFYGLSPCFVAKIVSLALIKSLFRDSSVTVFRI